MKKIKIAFIKYAGLATGGTEKHLQILSAYLPRDKFDITYFYCDASPYIGSDYKHPDTDPYRLKWMESKNVNLVKFNVGFKNVTVPTHDWVDTDFWEKFKENDFDIIQTGRAGHSEYPFTHINYKPMVDCITLPNMAETKHNIKKVVLISRDQFDGWVSSHNSEPEKAVEIPLLSFLEEENVEYNMRNQLGIDKNAIVFGMHQRDNDGIFSPVLLEAYSNFENENVHMVILGGSDLYKKQADNLNIKNISFVPHSGNSSVIHSFLNTLDVYTHARKDGETQGCVLVEAMFHGLPIVSHIAPAMGHRDTMGNAGKIAKNSEEYFSFMKEFLDKKIRDIYSIEAKQRYNMVFSLENIISKYTELYQSVYEETKDL